MSNLERLGGHHFEGIGGTPYCPTVSAGELLSVGHMNRFGPRSGVRGKAEYILGRELAFPETTLGIGPREFHDKEVQRARLSTGSQSLADNFARERQRQRKEYLLEDAERLNELLAQAGLTYYLEFAYIPKDERARPPFHSSSRDGFAAQLAGFAVVRMDKDLDSHVEPVVVSSNYPNRTGLLPRYTKLHYDPLHRLKPEQ